MEEHHITISQYDVFCCLATEVCCAAAGACAFDWPVNLAVASPSEVSAPTALMAVVGDDPEGVHYGICARAALCTA